MKRKLLLTVGLLLALFLTACGANPAGEQPVVSAAERPPDGEAITPQADVLETIVDEQGAVSVAITPVDLSVDAPVIDFDVALNTHSVELDMDLAALATLTTDNGHSVAATLWDAVPGGHHISGVLSFPASVDGTAVLEGASQVTLTIVDVDAPKRTFAWSLAQ